MQSKKILLISLVSFLSTCLNWSDLSATMLRKLSEKQLAKQAQTILIGTCTSIKSEWNEERTKIFTYITVLPKNYLKGDGNSAEITIRQLGGIVGDVGMHVDKTSVFEEGDEVLVFLKMGPKGYQRVVGLMQGKFTIQHDEETGRKTIVRKRHRYIRQKNGRLGKKYLIYKPKRKVYLDEFAYRIKKNLRNEQ